MADDDTYTEPTTISIVHRNAVPVDAVTRVLPPSMAALAARADKYAKTSRSPATLKAYAADLKTFRTWTDENLLPYLPTTEEVVVCYAAHLADAGRKVSTIERALSAIMTEHKQNGHRVPRGPLLEETFEGIRRQLGTKADKRAPLTACDLKQIIDEMHGGKRLIDHRDRLMLVLGWAGAFRRSEIVALQVSDVVVTRHGLEVTIRKSKTDQRGEGRVVGLCRSTDERLCPVALLRAWLEASGITTGSLFRAINQLGLFSTDGVGADVVARVLKSRAGEAGLDTEKLSGHSLRSGFMTEASQNGKSMRSMMQQSGHRSMKTALGYIQSAEVWIDNASKGLL